MQASVATIHWNVDSKGFLRTPSGAKAARVDGDKLMLYDQLIKREVPFSLRDWARFFVSREKDDDSA